MMHGRIAYHGAGHAIWSVVSTQGVSGLMRGYWATNCVWIPWNMLYTSMFEAAKRQGRGHFKLREDQALPDTFVAGSSAAAATIAGVLTHPADVIKTRLQVCTTA